MAVPAASRRMYPKSYTLGTKTVFRPAFWAALREVRANLYHSVDSNQAGSTVFTPSTALARGKYVAYISAASTCGRTSAK